MFNGSNSVLKDFMMRNSVGDLQYGIMCFLDNPIPCSADTLPVEDHVY